MDNAEYILRQFEKVIKDNASYTLQVRSWFLDDNGQETTSKTHNINVTEKDLISIYNILKNSAQD